MLVMPQYLGLHKALWERQQSALRRSQPEALAVAEAAKQAQLSLFVSGLQHLCLRTGKWLTTRVGRP